MVPVLLAVLWVGWVDYQNHVGFFERSIGHHLQAIYDHAFDKAHWSPGGARKLDASLVALAMQDKGVPSMKMERLWVKRDPVLVGSEELFLVTGWPENKDRFVGVTAGRTVKPLRRGEWVEGEFMEISGLAREGEIDDTDALSRGVKY